MKSKPATMDASQNAARVVNETISRHSEPLPADLEKRWEAWSKSIANVDTRTMTLLRAAFEAGAEAGRPSVQGGG